MITDFIIADPSEPGVLSGAQAGSWPRLQLRGLDNMMLADLWTALDATQTGDSLRGEEFLVAHPSPLIFRLPDDFTARLGQLAAPDLSGVADRWASGEEIGYHGWSGRDVSPVLETLSAHAAQAVSLSKPMLLAMYV